MHKHTVLKNEKKRKQTGVLIYKPKKSRTLLEIISNNLTHNFVGDEIY